MTEMTDEDVEWLIEQTFTDNRPDGYDRWDDEHNVFERFCSGNGVLGMGGAMVLFNVADYSWSLYWLDSLCDALGEDRPEGFDDERYWELKAGAPLTDEEEKAFGRVVESRAQVAEQWLQVFILSAPQESNEKRVVYFISHWGVGGMGPEEIDRYGPLRSVEEIKEALTPITEASWIVVNSHYGSPDMNELAAWVQERYDLYARTHNSLTREAWKAQRSNRSTATAGGS